MAVLTGGGLKFRHIAVLAVVLILGISVGVYAYDQENPYGLSVSWPDKNAVAAIAWTAGGQIHNEEAHGGHWTQAIAPAHRWALLTVSATLVPRGPVTCAITYKGVIVDGPHTHVGVHCQTASGG